MIEPEDTSPRYLRLDLFPATIESKDEKFAERRVTVTDTHMFVFSNSPKGPTLQFSAALFDFIAHPRRTWTVLTEDQEEYNIRRSESCGCGNRLRGYKPFKGVPLQR